MIPSTPVDGWSIQSTRLPPKINMNDIIEFRPGMVIPHIKLQMKWVGEGEPKEGIVRIGVQGGDFESFRIPCGRKYPAVITDERAQELIDQAMKSGSLKQRNVVGVITGR